MKGFLLLFAIYATVATAHQNSVTDEGKKLFLANPNVAIELRNSSSYLNLAETSVIVEETLQNWNLLQTNLQFKVAKKEPSFQIVFDNNFSHYGSAVVGVTEITYNKEGAIQKAIIKLNNNVRFSNDKSAHVEGNKYLGDVLTHELGHLVGLGHSEVFNAAMFFESFPGQHILSKDDIAGVRSLYSLGHGKITGTVMGGNHIPVLGSQVKAISRLTGEAVSTVSDEEGRFAITGLDLNDSYYLYVSPTIRVNDLPPYYANTQNNFCPATFKGGFFTPCGANQAGNAQSISLSNTRRSIDVGIVTINCSLRSSPEYAASKMDEESEAILLWDSFADNSQEKNHIGYFFAGQEWSKWDKFRVDLRHMDNYSYDKFLRIGLVSYPFGNLLEYELKVLQDDQEITTLRINQDLVTRTYNNNLFYDLPLSSIEELNEFEIHLRAKSLEGIYARWTYPALEEFFLSQKDYPYLLTMGIMQGSVLSKMPLFNTEQLLSDNGSCLDGPFTFRVERNRPNSESMIKEQQGGSSQLSCGTIEPPSNSPPAGGLFSLCLGFMMASLTLLLKKTKKTLS